MAGIDNYSDNIGDDDDFDELDNSQRLNLSSRIYNYPIENFNYYSSPRDLTLNLPKTATNSFKSYQPVFESPESEDPEISMRRYLSVSVSLVSLITENIISHPFVVLRRQCQVHHNSKRYHILPVRLVPVIFHLYARQGISTLWKGLGSTLLVRGSSLAVEDVMFLICNCFIFI
jgi:solute carrier family 25, member 46